MWFCIDKDVILSFLILDIMNNNKKKEKRRVCVCAPSSLFLSFIKQFFPNNLQFISKLYLWNVWNVFVMAMNGITFPTV